MSTTPTPRTDKECHVIMTNCTMQKGRDFQEKEEWVPASFARQLEAELANVTAERDRLERIKLEDRNLRLPAPEIAQQLHAARLLRL